MWGTRGTSYSSRTFPVPNEARVSWTFPSTMCLSFLRTAVSPCLVLRTFRPYETLSMSLVIRGGKIPLDSSSTGQAIHGLVASTLRQLAPLGRP